MCVLMCVWCTALVGWGCFLFIRDLDSNVYFVAVIFLSIMAAVIRWTGARLLSPLTPVFNAGFNLSLIAYLIAASGGVITRNKVPIPEPAQPVTLTAALFFKGLLQGAIKCIERCVLSLCGLPGTFCALFFCCVLF
jgi:hypothetical protein